jgi:hypothetical protein
VNRRPTRLRRPLAVLALASAVAGGAGCFYTDPINTRPDVRIEKLGSDPVQRGAEVALVAYLDDPDGDTLDLDWIVRACSSDDVCDDVPVEPFGSAEDEASIRAVVPLFVGVDSAPVVALRANVVATDHYGAEATDMLYLDAGNAAPAAAISEHGVRGPFAHWRIDTPVVLSAVACVVDPFDPSFCDVDPGATFDPEGDSVEFTWDITPPRGVMPEQYTFGPGDGDDYELRAIVGGDWIVELTVTDALGASRSAAPALIVIDPDAAPCIVSLGPALPPDGVLYPLVDDEEGDDHTTRFKVLQVEDDLDLYPVPANGDGQLAPTTFRWSLASPSSGGVFVPVGGDLATFDLDHHLFNPGDELSLRVEVDDRQERALPCDAAQSTCSVGDDRDITGDFIEDVCLQRQTWQLVVGQALP